MVPHFIQTGCLHTFGTGLYIGSVGGPGSSYNLSGGSLRLLDRNHTRRWSFQPDWRLPCCDTRPRNPNRGIFHARRQSFVPHRVIGHDGAATFTQTGGTVTASETLTISYLPSDAGVYSLSGGRLQSPQIMNNGQLLYNGGSLSGNVSNSGLFALSGSGTRTVNGSVDNQGAVQATSTVAQFTCTLTNEGAY